MTDPGLIRSPTSRYGAINADADPYKFFVVSDGFVNSADLAASYGCA